MATFAGVLPLSACSQDHQARTRSPCGFFSKNLCHMCRRQSEGVRDGPLACLLAHRKRNRCHDFRLSVSAVPKLHARFTG